MKGGDGIIFLNSMRCRKGGEVRAERELVARFGETCSMQHLYQYCFRVYRGRRELQARYSGLFSGIHLLHCRTLLQQKEGLFIKEWSRLILAQQPLFSYASHAQELITLLEIVEQRRTQVSLLLAFLRECTAHSWVSLEGVVVGQLDALRAALLPIVQAIMENNRKNSAVTANQIEMTVGEEQVRQEAEGGFDWRGKEGHQWHPHKQSSNGPYQVSSIKLLAKEKPTAVKLLSREEVLQLRREIHSRQKSTTLGAGRAQGGKERTEGSEKVTECKKSQNYNTYHTEISEGSEESSEDEPEGKSSVQRTKQGSRFAVGKHHKSNFEDGRRLKKLLEGKEGKEAFKSNSIHKIEGINSLAKYHKAIEEPPSRNTIQTSSINRFATENPAEPVRRHRNNKISIVGKLERTIKKIQLKNLKRPRGGMYISDDKLKEISQIYRTVRRTEELGEAQSDKSSSHSCSDSLSSTGKQLDGVIAQQDKRVSQFIQSASQKEHHKNRRRFGVSSKAVNSNKSIDWGSLQARNASEKNKYSDVMSRTSIFRSSGSNLQEKRSNVKSRYNQHHESHKRMKLNKSQNQCFDERQGHQFEQMAKQYALSKKPNHKFLICPEASRVERDTLVSSHEMTKLISQIHQQDRLDRQNQYQDYYCEVLRRKYEGTSQHLNGLNEEKHSKLVKMENRVQIVPSRKRTSKSKQELLLELMIKAIKVNCQISIDQMGLNPTNLQDNTI